MSDEDKRLEEEQATQMLHDSLYDEEKEREAGILKVVYDSWKFDKDK